MREFVFLLTLIASVAVPGAGAQETQLAGQGAQTIRPGDVIRLRIWREDDMSGEFPVDQAGMVIFPRVGEYMVLDDTNESLQARLLADYQRYLRNPSIDIVVLRRISITGSVNQPGLHMVDPTITLRDALAMAGGATPIGDPDKLRVIRDGEEIAFNVRQEMRLSESPIRSGDQLYVPERSWLSRNTNIIATVIGASVSLFIAVVVR